MRRPRRVDLPPGFPEDFWDGIKSRAGITMSRFDDEDSLVIRELVTATNDYALAYKLLENGVRTFAEAEAVMAKLGELFGGDGAPAPPDGPRLYRKGRR